MADPTQDHPLQFKTQYVKDLSFENPNAPDIYRLLLQSQPEVSVNIDVKSRHLGQRSFEVVLVLRAGAGIADKSVFLVDLQYAALVDVNAAVPEADIEPLLMREAPRFMFPFARSTVADLTREGGFPPLVINPIDFDHFYERRKSGNGQETTADA